MLARRSRQLGASAVFALLAACGPDSASKPGPAPTLPKVHTINVELKSVPNIVELSGRARALIRAEIRPQVSGIIRERLFAEGEVVMRGQALYQIDPAEYASGVVSAKATLANVEAAAESARQTVTRYEKLAVVSAVSQQEYEQASAAAKQAEADIALQRAILNRAEIDLSRTLIVSPITGNIGRSEITEGALVTQNQPTALAYVVQLDPINIDLTASVARIMNIREQIASGQIVTIEGVIPVTVKFENGEIYKHQGRLQFSEVIVDETAGTVGVRVEVANPDSVLLPGMFLRASLAAGRFEDAVEIPQALVGRTPKGEATVLIVDADGKIEQRLVTVAGQSGNSWIISDGLRPGDKIAVSNLQSLRPGLAVQSTPTSESADGTQARADDNAALK